MCGSDGCDGDCGTCENVQEACVDGQCVCAPYCNEKECGDDGCGGSCGSCEDNLSCTEDLCKGGGCFNALTAGCLISGACYPEEADNPANFCQVCDPVQSTYSFSKKEEGTPCGPNGTCKYGKCKCTYEDCLGTCCNEGESCHFGICCSPDCGGKGCGDDGCGGSCGGCEDGLFCTEELCVDNQCVYLVDSLSCAIDGKCVTAGTTMQFFKCQVCLPAKDQFDWSQIDEGQWCNSGKFCHEGLCCDHVSNCVFKDCGSDGCGWNCGTCLQGYVCGGGKCVCTPKCELKECGPDSCGGSCGKCEEGEVCKNGLCKQPPCEPNCDEYEFECGPDGCGGACGACIDGISCTKDTCKMGKCDFKIGHSYCVVNDQCIVQGNLEPENPCRKCQPKLSQTEYSPIQDGVTCATGKVCFMGECCPHAANCQDKECGTDACGGHCGLCPPGQTCLGGECV